MVYGLWKARKHLNGLDVLGLFKVGGNDKPALLFVVGLQGVGFDGRHEVYCMQEGAAVLKFRGLRLQQWVTIRQAFFQSFQEHGDLFIGHHSLSHKVPVVRIRRPR